MNTAPRLALKTFDLSDRQFYLAEVIAGDDDELTSLCAVNMELLHAVVQIARRPNPGRIEAIKDAICEHCATELAAIEANDNGGPDQYTHAVSLQSVYINARLIAAAPAMHAELAERRARDAKVAELVEAARIYFRDYCQDEAGVDGCEATGCSMDQRDAAARLRDALTVLMPLRDVLAKARK